MTGDYLEVRFAAEVDSGELLAFLPQGDSLGCWEEDGVIHLVFAEELWGPEACKDLEQALKRLGISVDGADIAVLPLPDRDWNASWAGSVQPVQIGRRVLIRQTWNQAKPPPGGFELIIDPKRAFGTGYHATTQLLVEWLEEELQPGECVLDIGTGSGILAMVALRLGATAALAVDNDPIAIECARENAAVNGFGPELEIRLASLEDLGTDVFELIVANLDRRTILALVDRLSRNLGRGGRLLLSGLQAEDAADIDAAVANCGGAIVARREREGWIALEVRFSRTNRHTSNVAALMK